MKITSSRFELGNNHQITFANYRCENKILYIDHIESPPEFRGQGLAGKLMQEIADHARKEKLKIVPICGYAAVWLRRHKDYSDLVV